MEKAVWRSYKMFRIDVLCSTPDSCLLASKQAIWWYQSNRTRFFLLLWVWPVNFPSGADYYLLTVASIEELSKQLGSSAFTVIKSSLVSRTIKLAGNCYGRSMQLGSSAWLVEQLHVFQMRKEEEERRREKKVSSVTVLPNLLPELYNQEWSFLFPFQRNEIRQQKIQAGPNLDCRRLLPPWVSFYVL